MKETIKRGAFNLLVLMLGWLPLFIVAFLLVPALLRGRQSITDLSGIIEAGGFYYLTFFLPVLLGGLLHQGILAAAERASLKRPRMVAIVVSPVIPAMVIAFGTAPDLVLRFAPAILVWLLSYCAIIRLPVLIRQEPQSAAS